MGKKALLVGILYRGTKFELTGCINDVNCMADLLVGHFGYNVDDIVKLNDDTKDKPTKTNILKHLKMLLHEAIEGDSLVFYYSGHGTQVKDESNDETCGFDDALFTLDEQLIIDDEILKTISHLNGASITMFFDCCHSGTMSDLMYNLRYKGKQINGKQKFEMWTEKGKAIRKGYACMFSGCLDKQTSADASFKRDENEIVNNGAFTYHLIKSLEALHFNCTNRELLVETYYRLRQGGFQQIPQYSCSKMKLLDTSFTI